MGSLSPESNQIESARENHIERLVFEIGQVIGEAPAGEREELRQMASDLLNEEIVSGDAPDQQHVARPVRPLSGLAVSGLILILGIALLLFLPLIGITLVCFGIIGLALSLFYKALPDS